MALETLAGVKEIDGFAVTRGVSNFSSSRPIFVHDETNQIAFKIQDGPVQETGINGCQVDQVIHVARLMIEGLNNKYPCRENSMAITKLDEAMQWLTARKTDRVKRQVEGTSQQ